LKPEKKNEDQQNYEAGTETGSKARGGEGIEGRNRGLHEQETTSKNSRDQKSATIRRKAADEGQPPENVNKTERNSHVSKSTEKRHLEKGKGKTSRRDCQREIAKNLPLLGQETGTQSENDMGCGQEGVLGGAERGERGWQRSMSGACRAKEPQNDEPLKL